MAELNIKKRCPRCLGTGADNNIEPPMVCLGCNGSGYILEDKLDILSLQDDITKCLRRLRKIMDAMGLND